MSEKKNETGSFDMVSRTLRYFFPVAWRFRKSYFLLWIVKAVCEICQPFVSIIMTPLLVDELLGGRNVRLLVTYTAILVLAEAVLSASSSLIGIKLEKVAVIFENFFTEEMSKRVMTLDFQLTEDKQALDQIEKARTGMNWYSGGVQGLTSQFFNILSNALKIIGVIAVIAINAPLLVPVTAVLLVINTILKKKINEIEIRSFHELSKENRVFGYVLFRLAQFQYGKDIRLYSAEKMMYDKAGAITDSMTSKWKKQADDTLPVNLKMSVVDVIRDIATYFYLGFLVIIGRITIGTFSQLLNAGAVFHASVQNVIWGVQEIIKSSGYAYEYVKFMDYPAAMYKGIRRITGNNRHTIEFRNVSFTYPNTEIKVLNNVSITLKQGEHLSVVGLNGAGKTTFIKLLCRLYDPTEGAIIMNDFNVRKYDYRQYLDLFSVVFQDLSLLAVPLGNNVAAAANWNTEKAEYYLREVGFDERYEEMPKKLETPLYKNFDEDGVNISGGEAQKIALARALYRDAPFIILDEPTAALDPVAEAEIYTNFDRIVGDKTAIYISHRLSSCRFCDKIAVFDKGKIVQVGTHEELLADKNGKYYELWYAQAQYYTEKG